MSSLELSEYIDFYIDAEMKELIRELDKERFSSSISFKLKYRFERLDLIIIIFNFGFLYNSYYYIR